MKLSNFVLTVCVLTVSYAGHSSAALSEAECSKRLVQAEDCFKQATLIEQKLPLTEPEIKTYCGSVNAKIKCHNRVLPCFPGFQRTLITIVTKAAKSFIKKTCKTPTTRALLLDDMKCIGDLPWGPGNIIHRFSTEFRLQTELASNQTLKNLLPYFCCGYQHLYSKALNVAVAECSKKGINLKDHVHYFPALVRYSLNDAADLVCGQLTSSKSCEANFAGGLQEIKNVIDREDLQEPARTFYGGLVHFLRFLTDDS